MHGNPVDILQDFLRGERMKEAGKRVGGRAGSGETLAERRRAGLEKWEELAAV